MAETVLNQAALGHMRLNGAGQSEVLKIEDRKFLKHQYLWPFHESSFQVEPNLVQNPGY
ncbi:hypothetical protein D3C80_847960 [compost metagenome]